MKIQATLGGLAALLLISVSAHATPITANYSVDANTTDPGLIISTSGLAANPFSFNLTPGSSTTFDLFSIKTTESSVEGSDFTPKPISVGFDFTAPGSGSTSVNGDTYGNTDPLLFFLSGYFQNGVLTWDGPADFFFGTANDGHIQIALSDETFNHGSGFGLGYMGATVEATLSLIADATVSTPGTLLMFGLAFLGLILISSRRRAPAPRLSI